MGTPKNVKCLKTPLSTIKKGPVKGLKNILSHPHQLYWPIVRDEKGEYLLNILRVLLPSKIGYPRELSWAQLRKMTKEERAVLKKETKAKQIENKDDKSISNNICLGINAVARALEKDSLVSVLLDCNVEPLIMIKHVVTMCRNKNLPVILVPFLKNCTLERLGFASAALGLKKSSIEDRTSNFYKLHENILSLADRFSNTKNSMQLFNGKDEEDDDHEENKELPKVIPLELKTQRTLTFQSSTTVYLQRQSVRERAFVPPEPQNSPEKPAGFFNEFIHLGDDVDMDEFNEKAVEISKRERYIDIYQPQPKKLEKNSGKIENELKNHKTKNRMIKKHRIEQIYCPLKVKRVQGNSQRLKATKTPKIKTKASTGKKENVKLD